MKTFLQTLIFFFFLLGTFNSFGQIEKSSSSLKNFKQKNKHGFKISLNSLINEEEDYIGFSYEYAKKNRQSYLFSAGIKAFEGNKINTFGGGFGGGGIGGSPEIQSYPKVANGIYLKFSTRFYSSSMQPRHFDLEPNIFRGFYIEPEIILGFYKRNYFEQVAIPFSATSSFFTASTELTTKNINYQAVMINFGRQGVLENLILLDFSFGFGVAIDNLSSTNGEERSSTKLYNHGVINKSDGGLTLATSVSLKIGGIF